MSPRHRVSRAAIELIKQFEGYRQTAVRLPDGRWTIGHGHTLTAREGARVSEADAEALLIYDLLQVRQGLGEVVFAPLNPNQWDALSAFVFNIGLDEFAQSGVLKRLNQGDLVRAACAMELWRKALVGGEAIVVEALVRRRAAEKALFLTPPDGAWVAAPTPLLRPLLDTDVTQVIPAATPARVTAETEDVQLVLRRDGEAVPRPIAPEPAEEEALGPVKAAAETVTARLATLFQEEPVEAVAAPAEPEPDVTAAPQPVEDPVPMFLRAPDPQPESEPEPEPSAEAPSIAPVPPPETEELREADLFDAPEPPPKAKDGDAVIRADAAEPDALVSHGRRRTDDIPFPFSAPIGQPAPERPEGGTLTLVALAALGLIFFGGGIFWATYARPIGGAAMLGPRLVGGLAGVAGVGFFVVAVYLLLDRLGRAAERSEV